MTKRLAVAVYARISQDRGGDGLGVGRQLADCRAEVARRGWVMGQEYVDDDVSAFSGKLRPAYTRMLRDLAAHQRDAVVVWHMDRLHRRPVELEEFAATCEAAGVVDVVTLHGTMDLRTGDGLLMARLLAAVAANESDGKRRRGRRKMQELAEAGKPHGGGTRPFGFEDDKITHRPAEAEVLRVVVARALAGETVTALARWLEEAEVLTVTGKTWRPQVLRQLLVNPRNWGMRSHNGETLHPAVWDPIIDPTDGERLRVLLTDPGRRTNRSARRYLLSGLCRCALCGSIMYSVPRFETRRYLCRSTTGFGGCGKMAITAELLERFLLDAVLYRLDSPAMDSALRGSAEQTEEAHAVALAMSADRDKLEQITDMLADGEMSRADYRRARDRVTARLADGESTLARMTQSSALDGLIGQGVELRARWDQLTFSRQVAIVQAVVDHLVIHPAAHPGRKGLDPDRVEAIWRL